MNKANERLFETDKRMELKLRLAVNKAASGDADSGGINALFELPDLPHGKLLRLIDRVRRL
jgi:hypothetical protein